MQFDTIYHEHFFYLSLTAIERIFGHYGLRVFDVEKLSTHGGSLRIYAERSDRAGQRPQSRGLELLRVSERRAGVESKAYYDGFGQRANRIVASVRDFLETARGNKEIVLGYGAAAKGNTLLNACGVTQSDMAYVVDLNPHKQGLYLPGSRLPVYAPDRVLETRPNYVFILPWNLKGEIVQQMKHIASCGGKFVTAIPKLEVFAA